MYTATTSNLSNSCVLKVENLWTASSVSTKFYHLMAAFHRAVGITGSRQKPVLESVCRWVHGNRELLKTTITLYYYIITSISRQSFARSLYCECVCVFACVRAPAQCLMLWIKPDVQYLQREWHRAGGTTDNILILF